MFIQNTHADTSLLFFQWGPALKTEGVDDSDTRMLKASSTEKKYEVLKVVTKNLTFAKTESKENPE